MNSISSVGKASPNPSVEAIDKAMKQRIGEIRTGMPGEIISFDAGTCMATVKPLCNIILQMEIF